MTCSLEDFYAGDWVDKLDESKVNHDERMVVANGGTWALGRKADEQIYAALDGTTGFVGTHTGGMTRALFLQAVEALDDNDVPNDGNRWGQLTFQPIGCDCTIDLSTGKVLAREQSK